MKNLLVLLMMLDCYCLGAQTITTFAGGLVGGYSGDGGAATAAECNRVAGVACDTHGNVFIADFGNNAIRKVDASGVITTVAGTGTAGYSGDGGAATAAKLYHTAGVAVDNAGNVFIADSWNNVVRKVNSSGIITTIAGTGAAGYTGDGGPATAATLDDPNSLTVDAAGNVYIADAHNNVIRKVSTSGMISTVVGNGYNAGTTHGGYSGDGGPAAAAELYYPESVAFDGAGNMYIAELYNNVVRKVSAAGIISTFAGNNVAGYSGDGSPATSAQLGYPYDVVADASGNIYIADASNNVIRKVNASGIISTYAGNGTAGETGDGGAATAAELSQPTGCAVDGYGNLYIADNSNVRLVAGPTTEVRCLSNNVAGLLTIYPNPGKGQVTINAHGNAGEQAAIVITDVTGRQIKSFSAATNTATTFSLDAAPGVYLITATTAYDRWSGKIVIER